MARAHEPRHMARNRSGNAESRAMGRQSLSATLVAVLAPEAFQCLQSTLGGRESRAAQDHRVAAPEVVSKMYYADNSHETQIAGGPSIRAIGWLDGEHPFSMGSTSAEFRDRLRALCNRWPDGLEALGW